MLNQENRDKRDELLVQVTNTLINQVAALVEAVKIQNLGISELKREINMKPDDAEVKFIAKDSKRQRKSYARQLVIVVAIFTMLLGLVSYTVIKNKQENALQDRARANHQSCLQNNEENSLVAEKFTRIAEQLKDGDPRLKESIRALENVRRDCDKLFPLEKK